MGLLDSSIGAFVLGTFLSLFLGGVTCTQVFYYFSTFGGSDKQIWKVLVSVLFVIDLFHTAISCYTVYFFTVTNYGNVAALALCPWTFTVEPAITGLTASIVQSFYAYRIFVIGGNTPYLPAVIGLLSAVQCGFAFGATGEIFHLRSEFARFPEWTYGVLTWLLTSAIADIIVTLSLIYLLQKSSTGLSHTNIHMVIAAILRRTVETNSLTMTVAVIDAALFHAIPNASYHVIPQLTLVKLYFNSLLVSLNSRKSFREGSPTSKSSSGRQTHPATAIHISMQEFVETSGADKDADYSDLSHPRPRHAINQDLERGSVEASNGAVSL